MRVLITSSPRTQNSYVNNIAQELQSLLEVHVAIDSFWNTSDDYQVVHIQWPEELTHWRTPDADALQRIELTLQHWKSKQTRIVLTAHNSEPHYTTTEGRALYELLYQYADGIIHLGQYSIHHPAYRTKAKQTVIYHPNYASEANIKNQEHSKQELGLERSKHLLLSFGKIRHQAEEDFIVDAFVKQALPNTVLWICSALPLPSWKQQPLARWKGEARRRSLKKKQVFFLDKKIPSEEIPTLFSAADAIVLPRLNTLNSGVLFLAFTYGKVVIGPACGNMNEFLSKHNNPLFQPRNLQSLQHAFQQSIQADSRVGQLNKQFAEEFCNPSVIAKQHQLFYASLL